MTENISCPLEFFMLILMEPAKNVDVPHFSAFFKDKINSPPTTRTRICPRQSVFPQSIIIPGSEFVVIKHSSHCCRICNFIGEKITKPNKPFQVFMLLFHALTRHKLLINFIPIFIPILEHQKEIMQFIFLRFRIRIDIRRIIQHMSRSKHRLTAVTNSTQFVRKILLKIKFTQPQKPMFFESFITINHTENENVKQNTLLQVFIFSTFIQNFINHQQSIAIQGSFDIREFIFTQNGIICPRCGLFFNHPPPINILTFTNKIPIVIQVFHINNSTVLFKHLKMFHIQPTSFTKLRNQSTVSSNFTLELSTSKLVNPTS